MSAAGVPLTEDGWAILAMPDIRERLRQLVSTPGGMAPEAFGAYVKEEFARYGKIIRATGTRID